MITTIYSLSDPRTNEVRYVGKTVQPLHHRIARHWRAARQGRQTHVAHWLLSLDRLDLEPIVEILEIVEGPGWVEAEQDWIASFSNLTNHTIGGDGIPGFHHTEATRQRIAASHQGLSPSQATRLRRHVEPVERKHNSRSINRGSANGQARINDVVAQQIKILAVIGELNYQAIADIYGVSPALVGMIRRGERWSHLPTIKLS